MRWRHFLHLSLIIRSLSIWLSPSLLLLLLLLQSTTSQGDITSGFYGKGKKIAWEAWKSFPDVTRAFTNIAIHPFVLLTDNSHTFSLLDFGKVCSGNVQ